MSASPTQQRALDCSAPSRPVATDDFLAFPTVERDAVPSIPTAHPCAAPLRPKTRVDWTQHRLRCPHKKLHGTFATLDEFIAHVTFECAGCNPEPFPPPVTAACAPATIDVTARTPLEHNGFLDGDVDGERLAAGDYEVTVTISPGNRWFTIANTMRLIDFAVATSREKPVRVVFSDTINALNRGVKGKSVAAGVVAEEARGRQFLADLRAAIDADESLCKHADRIVMCGYREWCGNAEARRDRDAVIALYDTDDEFAAAVDAFTEPWSHKPWRETTDFHRACATQYFLEELASLTVVPGCASAVSDMEVYPDSSQFGWCAPRQLLFAKLFADRTRRHQALFKVEAEYLTGSD